MLTPRRGGSRPQSLHKKIANPRPSPYCVTSEIFCQKKMKVFLPFEKINMDHRLDYSALI